MNAIYIFPRTKFVDINSKEKQAKHISGEHREVVEAKSIEHEAEELCDLIHAAETQLRILNEKHGVNVGAIQLQVIEKNQIRGYYG